MPACLVSASTINHIELLSPLTLAVAAVVAATAAATVLRLRRYGAGAAVVAAMLVAVGALRSSTLPRR